MTFPYEVTVQSMRDIKSQAPEAICEMTPTPVAINLLVNRDNAALQRSRHPPGDAAGDRPQELLDILAEGQGDDQRGDAAAARRALGPAARNPADAAGLWPGYAGQPRRGPQIDGKPRLRTRHRLPVKVATRNIAQYRDPAVILIDQMKEIYIDGELDTVETANWFPKIARKDFMVGANLSGQRGRRPGRLFLRALCLRLGAQLHELLQPGARKDV